MSKTMQPRQPNEKEKKNTKQNSENQLKIARFRSFLFPHYIISIKRKAH